MRPWLKVDQAGRANAAGGGSAGSRSGPGGGGPAGTFSSGSRSNPQNVNASNSGCGPATHTAPPPLPPPAVPELPSQPSSPPHHILHVGKQASPPSHPPHPPYRQTSNLATRATHLLTAHTLPYAPHVDPTPPRCFDRNETCSAWASAGECLTNPIYMRKFCCGSCTVSVPKGKCEVSSS